VRHAGLALQEAHGRVHEAGNVDNRGASTGGAGERGRAARALSLRRLRRLSLLSSEFRHFVSAVETHVGGQVHGIASASLAARLRFPAIGRPAVEGGRGSGGGGGGSGGSRISEGTERRDSAAFGPILVGGGIHGNSGGGGSGGGCSRGRGGHKGGGAGVPRPTDLYELSAALVSHAAAVHDACLLSSRDAPLLRTIDAALQLALDFRATMRRAPPDRLLADGAMYAAVGRLKTRRFHPGVR
jgi:hypothetical protein